MIKEDTDPSKLVTTGILSVSPDGGANDEEFPTPGVEYDFFIRVVNDGDLPSGPFFVQFTLSSDADPPKELKLPMQLNSAHDAGLDSGASVGAVVHFGTFPNEFTLYRLKACIFSSSAPEQPIHCGETEFTVNRR